MAEIRVPGDEIDTAHRGMSTAIDRFDSGATQPGNLSSALGDDGAASDAALDFRNRWDDGRTQLRDEGQKILDSLKKVLDTFNDTDSKAASSLSASSNGPSTAGGGTAPSRQAAATQPAPAPAAASGSGSGSGSSAFNPFTGSVDMSAVTAAESSAGADAVEAHRLPEDVEPNRVDAVGPVRTAVGPVDEVRVGDLRPDAVGPVDTRTPDVHQAEVAAQHIEPTAPAGTTATPPAPVEPVEPGQVPIAAPVAPASSGPAVEVTEPEVASEPIRPDEGPDAGGLPVKGR